MSEANRERLARGVLDPKMLREYEMITGEAAEAGPSPTWAEFIAAKMANRAARSETGARDAKELRETGEQPRRETAGRATFLLGIKGLPRTNAATGVAPAETGVAEGWRA